MPTHKSRSVVRSARGLDAMLAAAAVTPKPKKLITFDRISPPNQFRQIDDARAWLSFHFQIPRVATAAAAVIRDEFGASIDNSKEKLIDDDGMTKNNIAASAVAAD